MRDLYGRPAVPVPVIKREYDPALDPWLPVRRLLTCPACHTIAPHQETGQPQQEYDRLIQTRVGQPAECSACHTWSILGTILEPGRRYLKGQRVPCPDYAIPPQYRARYEEER